MADFRSTIPSSVSSCTNNHRFRVAAKYRRSSANFKSEIPTWQLLGSVVNFSVFVRNRPKNQHLSPKSLQQSLDFHKRSFSPPRVLVYESDGVSRSPTFG